MASKSTLEAPDLRQIRLLSAESLIDLRTLTRYFRNVPVRPSTRVRIDEALRKLGLAQFIREPANDSARVRQAG